MEPTMTIEELADAIKEAARKAKELQDDVERNYTKFREAREALHREWAEQNKAQ